MVLRFVLLAFGITWILVLPLVLSGLGVLPPLPTWLHGLGALGPVAAAWLSPRDAGVYERRGPSRLSPGAVALALGTPILFAAVALAAAAVRGDAVVAPLSSAFRDPEWLVGLAVGSVLYGLGEEPGWRGWLQPRLQERRTIFAAAILLWPIWTLWHLPFFFYRYAFDGPATLVAFLLGLLAGAFWLAFLFDVTGSVLVPAAWHVLWNVANLALAPVSVTAVAVLNALMMVLGFATGGLLWHRARRTGGSVDGTAAHR